MQFYLHQYTEDTYTADGVSATALYLMTPDVLADGTTANPPTKDDVDNKIKELLGRTQFTQSSTDPGSMVRSLPAASPRDESLVCSEVQIKPPPEQAHATYEATTPDLGTTAVPFPTHAQWETWQF